MASLSVSHLSLLSLSPFNPPPSSSPSASSLPLLLTSRAILTPFLLKYRTATASGFICASYRFSSGGNYIDEGDDYDPHSAADCGGGFKEAVALFNSGDYYKCHDVLEDLWNKAQEPPRTLIHGILQCAVGFYHLFNQNHRGAMMELGEGLCKLRKMNFESGPFLQFEKEISAVLDFIYLTQLELAACTDDFCLALDQSERSYQLLGGYAAGQHLYCLESDPNDIMYIVFCPDRYGTGEPPKVKLPTLHASGEHLKDIEYDRLN